MKSEYDTILFDLDDTLVVTLPKYKELIIGNCLKKFGVNTTPKNIDDIWQGHNRENILRGFGIEPMEFWDEFTIQDDPELRIRYIVAHMDYSAIRKLRDDGYAIGIVTGSPSSIIPQKLSALGPEKIEYVSTFDPTGEKEKPNPWGIYECMKRLGAMPERTMYVGNATNDVITAKRAGVLDVFIRRDPGYKLKAIPTAEINSLYEIEKILY